MTARNLKHARQWTEIPDMGGKGVFGPSKELCDILLSKRITTLDFMGGGRSSSMRSYVLEGWANLTSLSTLCMRIRLAALS
jgi:hypothetical protein